MVAKTLRRGRLGLGGTPKPVVRSGVRPRFFLAPRSEEHTSELQSLMRISYAVFCLKKKKYIAAQCGTFDTASSKVDSEHRQGTTHIKQAQGQHKTGWQ